MPRKQSSMHASGSLVSSSQAATPTSLTRRRPQQESEGPRKRPGHSSGLGRPEDGETSEDGKKCAASGTSRLACHVSQVDQARHSGLPHRASVPAEVVQSSVEPNPEIILAMDLRENSTLGCAFFDSDNGALLLGTDVFMADLDVAEQILVHVQPSTVLMNGRAPEDLLAFLEGKATTMIDVADEQTNFILRALSSSDFGLRKAQDGLLTLQNPGPKGLDNVEADCTPTALRRESHGMKMIKCGTTVDLASHVSVSCAGAVLSELARRRSTEFLPGADEVDDPFQVTALDTFSLADAVYITQETVLALQIVQSEQHPNSQISGGLQSASGSKESLSIYGLFHHLAGTPQGRSSLRRLFLRPTQNMQIITDRHDFIALFVKPEHSEHMKQAAKALRKVGNVRRVLSQLHKGAESPSTRQSDSRGAWSTLRRFVTYVLKLREVIATLPEYQNIELLAQLVDSIKPGPLVSVGNWIEKTIDFEDSRDRQRSCVRSGVDRQLDEQRRLYDGMPDLLTHVVDQMRVNIPEWARKYIRSCIFLPQLGFLTVVDPNTETNSGGYEGEGGDHDQWEKMFTSDGVVCYKNRFMRQLDEEYGDMYCEIGDREVEIIHNLSRQVLEHEEILTTASDLCGHVDALLALAIGAEKYNWSRPHMTTSNSIRIKDGRHPLQELVVPCFIPNDCHLPHSDATDTSDTGTLPALVLTGPNHSGKSVYLKQTAAIIYLAQIGSYVPAESAVLGLTDKIFTRLSTRESVANVESAFAIELKQVAQAIGGATAQSLILIDEFGKGTSPDDGAGMLTALIDHFLAAGRDCPRLVIATHFHEIFEGGYLNHRPQLRIAHFEVEIGQDSQEAEDHLTYLFKLARGHSSSSFGCICAALNGVPSAVVRRAKAVSSMIARHEDLVTACSQLSCQEEEHLELAEAVARHFLEIDLDDPMQESQGRTDDRRQESSMMSLLSEVLDPSTEDSN